MNQSYSLNYLKIYFWKFLGIITGIVSMLVVVPKITADKEVYGIYVICISLTIFLQYADIGFLGAGQKYAAEYFGINDRKSEIRMLSFVHFILFIFICVFIIVIISLSFAPHFLITNLHNYNSSLAQKLLIILAFSSPMLLLERFCRSVFAIRIQDYIVQKIELIFNIFKILSVYIFFRPGHNDIVLYYLFTQFMNFSTILVSMYYIQKLYSYDLKLALRSFRFSREMYTKTKGLAFSSMFITLSWIIYYEMDPILIAKLFDASKVATYAIGLTFLSFSRTLYNTLYGPFLTRFNHLNEEHNEQTQREMVYQIIRITFPLCIVPTLAIIILMKPLILGWVGTVYSDSVNVAQILLVSNFWLFLITPISYMIIVKVKTRILYITGIILPLVFFATIFISERYVGILSFAIGKSLSLFVNFIYILFISSRILKQPIWGFVAKLIPKIILPIVVLVLVLYLSKPLLVQPSSRSIFFTIKVVIIGGLASFSAIVLYYLTDKFSRDFISALIKSIFAKPTINE